MKILFSLTLACASLASGFEIPKGTHHLGQLGEATEKAGKARQPIAFIIAEKEMEAT